MLSSQRSCIILSQSQRKLHKNTCCMAWQNKERTPYPLVSENGFSCRAPLTYICVCYAGWLRSFPTFCNPIDCRPSDSSVHGILQAGVLEWAALPSSRESSQPRDQTCFIQTSELWPPTLSWSQQTAPPLLSIGQLQGRTVSGLPSYHPHFHPTFPHLILVALFTPL